MKELIEASGVVKLVKGYAAKVLSQQEFDEHHKDWCQTILGFWENNEIPGASSGRAAKLLATYLKSMVVVQDNPNSLVNVIHPPIDRIILQNLEGRQRRSLPQDELEIR